MFLGVFFVVSGAYAVITYNHTHENLLRGAYEIVSQYCTTLLQSPDSMYCEFNSFEDNSTEARVYVRELNRSIEYSEYVGAWDNLYLPETIFAETGDYCVVNFSDEMIGYSSAMGVIDYRKFRNSMTDEQYNKIAEYLHSKPEKTELLGDVRYELVCRTFYFDNKFVYPKTVEIVVTNDINKWYVEDEPVESFELETDVPRIKYKGRSETVYEYSELYKSGGQHRNMIDTDFVLERRESRHLLDYVDNSGEKLYYIAGETKKGPFTYLFFTRRSVSSVDVDEEKLYYLDFAREYNVLSVCVANILIASSIIFVFFLLVGIIISRLSWKAIYTQIEQENIRRDMTKAMAHDLKTPLFIISGYAESLRDNINTDKRGYYADVIINQTVRMDGLVHSMLDFSRLDTDDFELNRTSFSLDKLVRSTVEKYPDSRLEYSCDVDCEVSADRNLLTSVIDNFIDNAVKYGMQDAPIEVVISDGKLSVKNSVEKEISKHELQKVWEPYTKLSTARNSKGNGLGLAIAKRIIEMHGFGYGAKSEKNTIEFWIKFN